MQRDDRWQIRIRELRKRFHPAMPEVLAGCDLDLERGKVNVVIGGSGQGKSVLIKHIIGLLRPDAGTVIHECIMAMEFGASAEDIARAFHGHPTLNEAVKEAALGVAGRAIHI